MATTGVINTTLMGLMILDTTYKTLGHATDASLSMSMEARDITSKSSGGYRALLEGLRSWSISSSAFFAFDASGIDIEFLRAAVIARSPLTVRFGTGVSGDQYAQGSAYLTSVETNSPSAEDNVSYSITLEGTGAITFATLT